MNDVTNTVKKLEEIGHRFIITDDTLLLNLNRTCIIKYILETCTVEA